MSFHKGGGGIPKGFGFGGFSLPKKDAGFPVAGRHATSYGQSGGYAGSSAYTRSHRSEEEYVVYVNVYCIGLYIFRK